MGSKSTKIQRRENSEMLKTNTRTSVTDKSKNPHQIKGTSINAPQDIQLTPENVLYLQRTVGNQAVTELMQAKLKIGQPGDEYEREADRVAEQVLRMPDTSAEQSSGVQINRFAPKQNEELQRQTITKEEKRKRPEETGMLQMKSRGNSDLFQRQPMDEEEEKRKHKEEKLVHTKEQLSQTSTITDKAKS